MGPRSRERVEAIAEAVGHVVDELRQQRAELAHHFDELRAAAGRNADETAELSKLLGETLASHEKQNTTIIRIQREMEELRDRDRRPA